MQVLVDSLGLVPKKVRADPLRGLISKGRLHRVWFSAVEPAACSSPPPAAALARWLGRSHPRIVGLRHLFLFFLLLCLA